MFRRYLALAVAVLFTGLLAGCENTDSWVDAHAAQGWSAQYGDAANSSYIRTHGPEALRLEWSRSVKGELGAQVALSADNRLAVNAQTAGGCSLMVWEADNNARQRWCTRLVLGGGWSSPLFDGFDNVYIGQPGTILSFPPTQWIRWRQPVIGMPTTPRILEDGQLLVVTHLGQVLVFDGHRGTVDGTPLDLVAGVDPTDSQRGLADCQPARSRCPVAAAPAFSHQARIVVLSVWQPGAEAPVLMGLRYHPGEQTPLTQEWTSNAVDRGPLASPVLSADGSTVYVNGRDQKLWALNSADGTPKWSVPLNYLAQTPPSVSPDGLIVAGGGPEAKLTAVRDAGDHGEVAWTRDDVVPLTTSSRAGGVGYTVAREGGHGQALVVFDTGDGHTLNSYPVPEATGWPVGVSIGHDHRIVTATSDGQVYGFAPA
ncbi:MULTISPECIES: outer membrane protein assembly factor BamB family protein [Mycolicibacterium]|uniref:Pyrrolo-quinoline quinone n=3 Tax=Mycolicibacterium TaxID=1866885 RepID=A0A378T782_9MYCO|nr:MULTISPECIES: PQQ-binding-like beta-propeller repeat protein [Mycolicibacterium]KLI06092.1 pyrrolo-quinoline quinone [Mycolicibacterium senegalense]KLO51132.1 pyrrolo-quinoline quinone [Mycolicibacterium senegalense]KMV16554.1 pyrrolo-quinoline quinone [Mycolicibacterium conceptionense]MCV7337972.1 PQQ-like beta-propeller repeat protein [Mycolicibacterium senegalense]MDR7291212.1 outer membrane protein assembly factor BamB [Mycolicibacterium senegalense]